MGLKPCRKCKKDADSDASVCPHCGVKNPTGKTSNTLVAIGAVALGVSLYVGSGSGTSHSSPPAVAAPPAETAEEIAANPCGKAPELQILGLSGRYGYVYASILAKRVAHDPDSIEIQSCLPAELTKKRCWVTSCMVRGKNAFGAKVLSKMKFSKDREGWRTYD